MESSCDSLGPRITPSPHHTNLLFACQMKTGPSPLQGERVLLAYPFEGPRLQPPCRVKYSVAPGSDSGPMGNNCGENHESDQRKNFYNNGGDILLFGMNKYIDINIKECLLESYALHRTHHLHVFFCLADTWIAIPHSDGG